ncbi:MAG: hypothetical protein KME14_26560 [Tildeniella torsiva UHER 1998/13D]|jgi:hypothetical protein|nr:hypothetical protein [Tildeniella torsiva UHER 1998/13D]
MTAFDPDTQLPATVNSIEKGAAWFLGVLYQLYKNEKYQESDASPLVPLVTAQDGLAADRSERVIFRVSLPLNDGWRTSPNPFWMEVEDITNAAIPEDFLP